ncbi:BolA family protein [Magnetospirillum moscoviense]|uniref:Transcriptional regulator n=1 Tax=Magnetospirillum moscoviense TaxID=1437059 RepID=A0A178MYU4_9PROT|nr:BolA family protein [Magnetospirillum moscoviense]OAN65482.1 transcriptional regulator [Magnetospirillum moscoviense]
MTVKASIERKLTEGLSPEILVVVDESNRHVGHAGHKPGGETHFNVQVVSAAFAGKSRIERHRLVNSLLADELTGPVHALALVTKAPGEV